VIGNIHTNVSVHQHGGELLVRTDRVLVHNSDTLKDMYCDVCVLYWLREQ